jgi:hypothetical protein
MAARRKQRIGILLLAVVFEASLCVCSSREIRADDGLRKIQEEVQALRGSGKPDMDIKRRVLELEQEADVPSSDLEFEEHERMRTHIKMDGGLAFPKATDVILPEAAREIALDGVHETWASPEYRKPERCDSDDTIQENIPYRDLSEEEFVLLDSLYVREEFTPVDPAEIYGNKTHVYSYGPSAPPGTFVRMREENVPCLPYRIRVTNKHVYRDRGENALKNYDADPSHRGKIHPWVAKKLDGNKR